MFKYASIPNIYSFVQWADGNTTIHARCSSWLELSTLRPRVLDVALQVHIYRPYRIQIESGIYPSDRGAQPLRGQRLEELFREGVCRVALLDHWYVVCCRVWRVEWEVCAQPEGEVGLTGGKYFSLSLDYAVKNSHLRSR